MAAQWTYAIEIQPNYSSLVELVGATHLYFKEHPSVQHEVVVEQAARIVVRFTSELDARNFFYANGKLEARFMSIDKIDKDR